MSQELILDKVRFRNFQSFGQNWTEIDLNVRGTTLVMGENLDRGGSSGAGKTTAITVVSYCLFDKIPTGVSKDKMINRTNDKKITSMEAELYFHINNDSYKVHRSRGAVTSVQLFHNGKDITPASVNHINEKIEEIIGFSYNLFSQIVLFNGNSTAFLDLSVSDQRNLIEELFKITLLSRKAASLKKDASETSKAIDRMKVLVKQQELQNEGYHKRVKEAAERIQRWSNDRDAEVSILRESLKMITEIDYDAEEDLHGELERLNKSILEVESGISLLMGKKEAKEKERPPSKERLLALTAQLSLKEKEAPASQAELNRLTLQLKKLEESSLELEKEITHLKESKCPYCLQDYVAAQEKLKGKKDCYFNITNEITLVTEAIKDCKQMVDDEVKALESELAEIRESISQVRSRVAVEEKQIAGDIESIIEDISEKEEKLRRIRSSRLSITEALKFDHLKEAIEARSSAQALEEQIKRLEAEENPHIDAHDKLVAEGEIEISYGELDELISLESHQKFLIKLLTDKNSYVRKNLIATTTPFLNKRIGYYTDKLNLPHVVLFQPDMSCEITELGRELDHGNLSNGEKKKLNLSICLAFRDVLTYLHSKVNVLFADEIDGGSLCLPSISSLIQLIKQKSWDDNISIFCISHSPEFEGRLDRTLVVRKENGFSSIVST